MLSVSAGRPLWARYSLSRRSDSAVSTAGEGVGLGEGEGDGVTLAVASAVGETVAVSFAEDVALGSVVGLTVGVSARGVAVARVESPERADEGVPTANDCASGRPAAARLDVRPSMLAAPPPFTAVAVISAAEIGTPQATPASAT